MYTPSIRHCMVKIHIKVISPKGIKKLKVVIPPSNLEVNKLHYMECILLLYCVLHICQQGAYYNM